jgi:hypothetical protein
VNKQRPAFFPALIDGGTGGHKSDEWRGAQRRVARAQPRHSLLGDRLRAAFNRVIDALRIENAVATGPDLYGWFAAHPDELRDGVHPNDRGGARP